MRAWLVLLAGAAIGCSSLGPGTGTTGIGGGRSETGRGGTGGMGGGGTTGGASGAGAVGGASPTGTGGNTGGNGPSGSGGTSTGGTGTGGNGTGGGGNGGTGSGGSGGAPDGGTAGSGGSGATGGTAIDAGTDAGSVDPQQACTAKAEAYCAKLQECSTFVMSVVFGNQATCKARWILNCTPAFGGSGTSATPARTAACAQAIPPLSCTTFLGGDLGPACAVAAGTVANGGPCGDDAQCASTFCAYAPDASCGTCQPTTNAGSPCVQSSCSISTNTVCPQDKTTCVKPKAGKVGDACVGQEECDVGHQVGCNTNNSKCIALTLTAAGGTCGANSLFPTSVAVCPNAGTCSASLSGTCTAFAADGASCSTSDTGAHCMRPARCVGGRCTLPNPAICR